MLYADRIFTVLKSISYSVMVGLLALAGGPLKAQGVFDMGSLTNTLSVDHVTQSESARSSGVRSLDLSKRTMLQLTQPVSTNHSPSDTAFPVSKKIRQQNLDRIVKKTAANDPAGAKEMERIFANADVIAEIGQGIAPFGLKTNNVADAYTVYWMTAWQAANQDNSDFDAPTVASVRQQSADILMSVNAFVRADDGIKQELAEIYLVQAALIQAVADNARSNPQLRSQLATAVKKGAKVSGLDLGRMTLTAEGFVLNGRKTDAASETESGAEKALAADEPADGTGVSGTEMALLAAAGGAGLAGVFFVGRAMGKKG